MDLLSTLVYGRCLPGIKFPFPVSISSLNQLGVLLDAKMTYLEDINMMGLVGWGAIDTGAVYIESMELQQIGKNIGFIARDSQLARRVI